MTHAIMTIEAAHRDAATGQLMNQFTRMDLRNEDGSFIMFWNRSTIAHLDWLRSEIEASRKERIGRVKE